MDTILRIKNPAILNLFRKMTNEQLGKILRAYLNKNNKGLFVDELTIFNELTNNRIEDDNKYKERTRKGWETRKKNGTISSRAIKNKLLQQIQRDKEEMIKLNAENNALKAKQYGNSWKNNKETNEITVSPAIAATFV